MSATNKNSKNFFSQRNESVDFKDKINPFKEQRMSFSKEKRRNIECKLINDDLS
jgi:hypothetical protein